MKISRQSFQKTFMLFLGIAFILTLGGTGAGCLFYRLFGIICPGCGMTRALFSCLRLDFAAAWRYHPMVFSLPYLALAFLKDGKVFASKALNICILCLIAAGFLIQYLYKLFYLQ